MGAVPSRETTAQGLSRTPFYGQRHRIALVPLTQDYFPSPDCPLFTQFYEALCDPAVRYYHRILQEDAHTIYQADAPTNLDRSGTTERRDNSSDNPVAEGLRASPLSFPACPTHPEALYMQYITHGGEHLCYNSDAEMLEAYRRDPGAVAPLPCAVAFMYSPAKHFPGSGEDDNGTAAPSESYPEGCVGVLGCYIKVTGFVGDLRALRHANAMMNGSLVDGAPPSGTSSKDMELHLYLTKSAGDQNRTHALFAAVYTYVEQWQRACRHHTAVFGDKGPHVRGSATAAGRGEAMHNAESTRGCHVMASEDRFGGKPLASLRTSTGLRRAQLFSSSGSVSNKRFLVNMRSDKVVGHGGTGDDSTGRGGGGWPTHHLIDWMPPPTRATRISSLRSNVPLLCFAREVRATLLGMYTCLAVAQEEDSVATDEKGTSLTSGRGSTLDPMQASLEGLLGWLEDVHPDGLPTPPSRDDARCSWGLAHFRVAADVGSALVEHVMACLLHRLNPIDVWRAATPQYPSADHRTRGDADILTHPRHEGESVSDPEGKGEACERSSQLPSSVALLRLPDIAALVEPWPPRLVHTGNAVNPTISVKWLSDVLDYLPNQHLFWVVGRDRLGATEAVQQWFDEGRLVLRFPSQKKVRPDGPIYDLRRINVGCGSKDEVVRTMSDLADFMDDASHSQKKQEQRKTQLLLSRGVVLELLPVPTDAPKRSTSRSLRVSRLPVEELLLEELSDACRKAREADPTDPHWVRRPDATVSEESTTASSIATAVPNLQISVPDLGHSGVPPVGADDSTLVREGTVCLWKALLGNGSCRVLAITPNFLKTVRKKQNITHRMAVTASSTASEVFFAPSMWDMGGYSQRHSSWTDDSYTNAAVYHHTGDLTAATTPSAASLWAATTGRQLMAFPRSAQSHHRLGMPYRAAPSSVFFTASPPKRCHSPALSLITPPEVQQANLRPTPALPEESGEGSVPIRASHFAEKSTLQSAPLQLRSPHGVSSAAYHADLHYSNINHSPAMPWWRDVPRKGAVEETNGSHSSIAPHVWGTPPRTCKSTVGVLSPTSAAVEERISAAAPVEAPRPYGYDHQPVTSPPTAPLPQPPIQQASHHSCLRSSVPYVESLVSPHIMGGCTFAVPTKQQATLLRGDHSPPSSVYHLPLPQPATTLLPLPEDFLPFPTTPNTRDGLTGFSGYPLCNGSHHSALHHDFMSPSLPWQHHSLATSPEELSSRRINLVVRRRSSVPPLFLSRLVAVPEGECIRRVSDEGAQCQGRCGGSLHNASAERLSVKPGAEWLQLTVLEQSRASGVNAMRVYGSIRPGGRQYYRWDWRTAAVNYAEV